MQTQNHFPLYTSSDLKSAVADSTQPKGTHFTKTARKTSSSKPTPSDRPKFFRSVEPNIGLVKKAA